MSYCVNCGVELDESAKKCVLCETPVINPAEPENKEPPPYSESYVVIPKGTSRKYAAFIISMVILIPNIVCALINFLVPSSGNWAVYVISASTMFWFLFIFPSLLDNSHPYILLSFDTLLVSLYIYVFFTGRKLDGWFLELAIPLILFFFAICVFMIKWLSRKRDGILVTIGVFAEIALFSLYTEFIVNRFYGNSPLFFVSLIITACCAALIIFFIFAVRNKRFRVWLSRKFFV